MTARLARVDRVTRWLLLIALLGLIVRVGYIAGAKKGPCEIVLDGQAIGSYHSECTGLPGGANDELYYNSTANWLARGHLFTDPFTPGHPEAADHPPLTAIVLAPVSFVFDHPPLVWAADRTHLPGGHVTQTHVREHRYFMALLGALVVLLIGLLARRLGGDRVAIVAALLAAVYPNLWVNDGLIFSETVANVVVVLALLAALRAGRTPSLRALAAVGALGALAALARAELGLLVVLLGVPIVWAFRGRRLAGLGTLLAAAAIVLAPWVVYNNVRFHDRTFISTNDGLAVGASNCDDAYYTHAIGLTVLRPPCTFTAVELRTLGDQSQVESAYRTRAWSYVKVHKSRAALVVAVRVLRTWSFWDPHQMVVFNQGENREAWVSWAGLAFYFPIFVAAVAGAVRLVRRRLGRALWVLATPAIAVTIGVALTYGQVRFRAAAEPSLVILAALALVAAWDGIAATRSGRAVQPSVAAGAGR